MSSLSHDNTCGAALTQLLVLAYVLGLDTNHSRPCVAASSAIGWLHLEPDDPDPEELPDELLPEPELLPDDAESAGFAIACWLDVAPACPAAHRGTHHKPHTVC